jgi:hypothetical protein
MTSIAGGLRIRESRGLGVVRCRGRFHLAGPQHFLNGGDEALQELGLAEDVTASAIIAQA